MKIKECCFNCHLLYGEESNCQGMPDFHDSCQAGYVQNKYWSENDIDNWVMEEE